MNTPFYILSIDGGGHRGIFAAHILKRMEEEWQIDWQRQFGMLAGTSTGAILAAGLACHISATHLNEFYETHGSDIFTARRRSYPDPFKLFTSRYSSPKLKKLLEKEFGETLLGEIKIPLILPAVDIGNGCVHVLKSRYDPRFTRDYRVPVSDAVLASCAAPTYFDPVVIDDKYRLIDGGLWANSPSLVAAVDATYRLDVPLKDIRVLSIGTGKSKVYYPRSEGKFTDYLLRSWQGWGFVTRWQRSKFIDLILNLQSENAHNTLCLLFGESPINPKRVLRLNFESDRPLPLDSVRKQSDWISEADRIFSHQSTKIAEFLLIKGEHQNE